MAGWGTVHQGIPPDNRLWLGDICLSSVCVTVNHLGWSEAGSQRAGKGLQRDRIVMLDLQCEGVAGAMRGTHCNVIWVDVSLLSPRSRSQGSGRSSDHEFLRRCPRGVGGGGLICREGSGFAQLVSRPSVALTSRPWSVGCASLESQAQDSPAMLWPSTGWISGFGRRAPSRAWSSAKLPVLDLAPCESGES